MYKIEIEVTFDAEKLGDRFDKRVSKALDDLAEATYVTWKKEAQHQLFTTRDRYVKALGRRKIDEFTRQIYLKNESEDDFLVNAIEGGYPPIPILPGMFAKNNPKLFRYSECAKPPNTNAKKLNPPFIDIPIRKKRPMRWDRCKYPNGNPPFRRVNKANVAKMIHPGFKPIGKGGLDKPLREYAIEHVQNVAQDIFNRVLKDDTET